MARDEEHWAREDDSPPPHNLDAERAVLGSLFFDADNSIYEEVRLILRPEHFYAHVHGTLYKRICELYEDGVTVDKISLAEVLQANNELEKVGGLPYINLLMDTIQTLGSARYYATLVVEKARLRGLMAEGLQLFREALNGEILGPEDVAATSLARIESVVESRTSDNSLTAEAATLAIMDLILSGGVTSIPSQWAGLNALIGGFAPGELVILGSNPGMGKTGVVTSLSHYLAFLGLPVGVFCLEMGSRLTAVRYTSMLTRIPTKRILTAEVTDDDRHYINEKLSAHFMNYPLRLFDKFPSWSTGDIRIASRKLKREFGGLTAIFVDHVGFLRDVINAEGYESKHERIDAAYKALLALAAELEITVFAVQHMNRAAKDGLPTMFDLRDGGNPEGNAHTIIIPWRPNPQHDDPEERTKGLFIVEKAREGNVGKPKMRFWGARGAMWVDEEHRYPWWDPAREEEALPEPETDIIEQDTFAFNEEGALPPLPD